MKKYLSLIAVFLVMGVQAQKLNELSSKTQDSFNKEWSKAIQYGIPATKNFKPKEDGSGTMPFLSKLPAPPKKVALVTFYVFDQGTVQSNSQYIYKVSINARGGSEISDNFLAKGLPAMKEEFSAKGMDLLTPDQFLDTPEKKQAYYSWRPNISGFTKAMEAGMNIENGSAAAASDYAYYYISDGRDFRLSESMGAQLCKALGVDAVLSVVNNCSTDGRYYGFNKISMVMHGPNPIARIPGHEYRGAMGANYQEGLLYQALWIDLSFLFKEEHPKKGVLYETYDGYEKFASLLAKTMAQNVTDRCAGKLGDQKGN